MMSYRESMSVVAFLVSLSSVFVCPLGPALAQLPPVNALQLGHWDEYEGLYSDVWGEGDYVYLPNFEGSVARVHVVDISQTNQPVLSNVIEFAQPNLTASPQDVKVADGLLFVALEGGDDGVAIVDVRDPTAPVELTTIRIDGFEDAHNVFYDEGFLYIVDTSILGMAIVDLTDFNPDQPPPPPMTEAKWVIQNIGSSYVHDVTVQNGRAYVAAWHNGVWIYDVSDVANTEPEFLGLGEGESTHSAWPTDDGSFVVTGEERFGGPVKLYGITDEDGFVSVTLLDEVDLSDDATSTHNQVVIGDRVYVSWYQAGLQVFDIDRDAGELVFRASFDTTALGNNGAFSGNWGVYPFFGTDKILLSDLDNGLFVVAVVPEDCTPGEDCNGNGILDQCDVTVGTSSDCNGTLIPDECELSAGTSQDCNTNGTPDECEPDCNGNAVADSCDIAGGTSQDCNTNEIPDECIDLEFDCNGNGQPDQCDIASGTSTDCNADGVPDECSICEPDYWPDGTDISTACLGVVLSVSPGGDPVFSVTADVSSTGDRVFGENSFQGNWNSSYETLRADFDPLRTLVAIDIIGTGFGDFGFLEAWRGDDTLIERVETEFIGDGQVVTLGINVTTPEIAYVLASGIDYYSVELDQLIYESPPDCNGNRIHDFCDIAGGTSLDCNANSLPDECEDCNGNGVADSCDLAEGTSQDCNMNGIPDDCVDLEDDCNENGIPDECIELEDDCNTNGQPDQCDLANGTSNDCNGNQIPDECDIAEGKSSDANGDSIPDECQELCQTHEDCDDGVDCTVDFCDGSLVCVHLDLLCPCEGDANGDGLVDPLDSGFVLSRLGCAVGTGDPNCDIADQNGDGLVDPLDVGFILARFGDCP